MIDGVTNYGFALLDPEGRVASWSKGAASLTGFRAADVMGRHFSVLYPEVAVERGRPTRDLESARSDGPQEEEGWRLRKDGTTFWANVVIAPLFDDAGEHVGFTTVTHDLTQRRAQEEELRQSERRLHLMIQAVRDYAIFLIDPHGNIVSWNDGARRIKGYTAEEVVGKHFSIFYPEESIKSGWPEHELRVAKRVGRFEDEGWRLRKDGSRFWANVLITALFDEDGEHIGFTKVTRDLTERREQEEKLRTSERRLAQANRELAQRNDELRNFAHVASHDLQEPLRKIRAFAEILEEEFSEKLDDDGRLYLDRVHDAARRMSVLIDELLKYSRLTTREPTFLSVDLNRVLEDVEGDLMVRLGETQGEITSELLPTVEGDPTQLRRLFQNLIGNALKFSEPGVAPKIDITWREVSAGAGPIGLDAHEISVADNGIGIEARHLDSIFAPFQRIHSPFEYEGSGLGLAICRRIAERHHGVITAESEPGRGTTFRIYLPRRQPRTVGAAAQGA